MSMTLISVNVGRPREVPYNGNAVSTGIFKEPVSGAVAVHRLNLAGDGQADLVHHGGEAKAVYAYSLDHYDWWSATLGREDLVHGQFGENLTIAGLDEAILCLGDQLRIDDARFAISQPRVPCFKLGLRFGDKQLPRLFAESLRTGIYLRVLDEGHVRSGDAVEVVAHGEPRVSIRSLFDAYLKPNDPDALKVLAQALQVPDLSDEWRDQIARRLQRRSDGAR